MLTFQRSVKAHNNVLERRKKPSYQYRQTLFTYLLSQHYLEVSTAAQETGLKSQAVISFERFENAFSMSGPAGGDRWFVLPMSASIGISRAYKHSSKTGCVPQASVAQKSLRQQLHLGARIAASNSTQLRKTYHTLVRRGCFACIDLYNIMVNSFQGECNKMTPNEPCLKANESLSHLLVQNG